MTQDCFVCGEPFETDDAGITNHVTDDGIDYDADADHVPYGEPDALGVRPEPTIPSHPRQADDHVVGEIRHPAG